MAVENSLGKIESFQSSSSLTPTLTKETTVEGSKDNDVWISNRLLNMVRIVLPTSLQNTLFPHPKNGELYLGFDSKGKNEFFLYKGDPNNQLEKDKFAQKHGERWSEPLNGWVAKKEVPPLAKRIINFIID
ncbi:MAG TPA: hypothetical protein VF185_03690 [Patescibacteria group bacterium]